MKGERGKPAQEVGIGSTPLSSLRTSAGGPKPLFGWRMYFEPPGMCGTAPEGSGTVVAGVAKVAHEGGTAQGGVLREAAQAGGRFGMGRGARALGGRRRVRVYGSGWVNSASFASPALTARSMSLASVMPLFASNCARSSKPRSIKRSRCTAQFMRFLSEWRYSFITRSECAGYVMATASPHTQRASGGALVCFAEVGGLKCTPGAYLGGWG